jgi:hypothetical protein
MMNFLRSCAAGVASVFLALGASAAAETYSYDMDVLVTYEGLTDEPLVTRRHATCTIKTRGTYPPDTDLADVKVTAITHDLSPSIVKLPDGQLLVEAAARPCKWLSSPVADGGEQDIPVDISFLADPVLIYNDDTAPTSFRMIEAESPLLKQFITSIKVVPHTGEEALTGAAPFPWIDSRYDKTSAGHERHATATYDRLYRKVRTRPTTYRQKEYFNKAGDSFLGVATKLVQVKTTDEKCSLVRDYKKDEWVVLAKRPPCQYYLPSRKHMAEVRTEENLIRVMLDLVPQTDELPVYFHQGYLAANSNSGSFLADKGPKQYTYRWKPEFCIGGKCLDTSDMKKHNAKVYFYNGAKGVVMTVRIKQMTDLKTGNTQYDFP